MTRNGTPERAAQCREAARLGGVQSGITRKRKSAAKRNVSEPLKKFSTPFKKYTPKIKPKKKHRASADFLTIERHLKAAAYYALEAETPPHEMREQLKYLASRTLLQRSLYRHEQQALDAIIDGVLRHAARTHPSKILSLKQQTEERILREAWAASAKPRRED